MHSLLSLDLLPPTAVPFSHCHDSAWVADTGLCEGVFNFLLPLQSSDWKPQEHQGFIPSERKLLCELVKDLAEVFGPDDTNSYSLRASPA